MIAQTSISESAAACRCTSSECSRGSEAAGSPLNSSSSERLVTGENSPRAVTGGLALTAYMAARNPPREIPETTATPLARPRSTRKARMSAIRAEELETKSWGKVTR